MKARELTKDERWLYMPKWEKAARYLLVFVVMLCSTIEHIQF